MPSVHHDRPAHAGEAPPERPAQPARTGCGWRLATDGQTDSFGRCHTEAQRPLARGDRATARSSSTQRRCTDGRPCRARPCGAAESRGQPRQAAGRQAELHQLPSGAVPAAQPLLADARAAVADARALHPARQGRPKLAGSVRGDSRTRHARRDSGCRLVFDHNHDGVQPVISIYI